jgi:medium-chain acyl-[acyl-carrier-protein] hydrolase
MGYGSIMGATDPWIPYRWPRPTARVRLLCLPHAGAGASIFRAWADGFPDDVEVAAVQLPGREARIGEAPIAAMRDLVPRLTDAVRPYVDLPFAIFGHSMGALVGFELARELRRRSLPRPFHLFASACRAPQFPDRDVVHHLPDAELVAHLRALGGASEAVLANDELMQLVLPALRADAAVTETYAPTDEPPLGCPITVFGGREDPKTAHPELDGWREHTLGAFALEYFPGDHFFLQSARPDLHRTILRALRASAPP